MRASMDFRDLVKDRRVIIGGVIVLLAIIGGIIAFVVSGNSVGSNQASLPPPGSLPSGGAPGAPGMASGAPGMVSASGAPGVPGAPIAVGAPGGMPGAASMPGTRPGGAGAVTAMATPAPNSFAGAPLGFGTGQTGVGGLGAPGGMPGGMPPGMPGAGGVGASAGGASAGAKPAPIVPGERPIAARMDPFIPFYKLIVEEAPAYSLIVPERLAARPTPPPIPPVIDPNIRLGPLPPVQRRVAGVLFDGSVSAILETGAPGSQSTDVRVIQPGATVPSGVPNIPDLTVASISPTAVLLRAQDGRTATVKLSNVSAEFADSFHNAANGPGVGSPGGGEPSGGNSGPRGGGGRAGGVAN